MLVVKAHFLNLEGFFCLQEIQTDTFSTSTLLTEQLGKNFLANSF